MNTNYERAKIVLEKLDRKARKEYGGSVDGQVSSTLVTLGNAYKNLSQKKRDPIDYSSSVTHLAYVFRCLACHADLLYRSLRGARREITPLFQQPKVKIACIGGGPGADALGIIKFLEKSGINAPKLRFTFLDREEAWLPVRNALFSTFDGIDHKRRISHLDLAAGPHWTKSWRFAKSDIFTISFCLSEVWSFDGAGSVSNFLDKVISSAKAGAIFVYTDNGGPSFLPKAEKCFGDRNDIDVTP